MDISYQHTDWPNKLVLMLDIKKSILCFQLPNWSWINLGIYALFNGFRENDIIVTQSKFS